MFNFLYCVLKCHGSQIYRMQFSLKLASAILLLPMTCFEVMKLERCVNLTRYFSPTTLRSLECLCFCVLLSNLLCSINPIENKAGRLYITNES